MEQYSGDFLAAVDGLRALLGCRGRVWPVSVERATLCAEYADGSVTRGEVEVDLGHARGHGVTRVWLEPPRTSIPAVHEADRRVRRGDHRPGQLLHQPDADAAGGRRRRAPAHGVKGPIILVTNLLTEGQGMRGFTAADAVRWVSRTIGRPVDVVIANEGHPSDEVLARYRGRAQGAARRRRAAGRLRVRDRPVLAVGHRASRSPPAVVRGLGGAQPPSVEVSRHRFRSREERHEISARRRHRAVARRSVARAGAGAASIPRPCSPPSTRRRAATATWRCRSGSSPRSATRSRRAARCCRSSCRRAGFTVKAGRGRDPDRVHGRPGAAASR